MAKQRPVKFSTLVIAVACLIATGVAIAATNDHANAINQFFADILLVVNGLKSIIEPIVGLAVAAMVAMQYVSLRRQKTSKVERAEQTATIVGQSHQLAHIAQQMETVKAAVVAPAPTEENRS